MCFVSAVSFLSAVSMSHLRGAHLQGWWPLGDTLSRQKVPFEERSLASPCIVWLNWKAFFFSLENLILVSIMLKVSLTWSTLCYVLWVLPLPPTMAP